MEPSTTKVVARSLKIGRKIKIAKIIHIATRAPNSAGSLFAIELLVCGNLLVDTLSPPRISGKAEEALCTYTEHLFSYDRDVENLTAE
jgi:hypothetical protein